MRSSMMAVALLLGLLVAAPAPASAGQKAAFEGLKVKRSGIQRSTLKRAPKKGRLTGIKKFFGRFKKVNRMQHSLIPTRTGDVRVFDLEMSAGATKSKGLLTQRVGEVRTENGVLRAQVAQTWESDGHSNTTHHVQEVGRRGVLMTTAEKLDHPPAVQVHATGVGLPRKLKVGQTWTNTQSWTQEGAVVEAHTTGRVLRKVRQQGPDRKMHDGFEIETVTHSTTTFNGEKHPSTHVMRSVYLKGIGEVESTSQVKEHDSTVTRRLIGFTPGE
jgi:hypothetical protein